MKLYDKAEKDCKYGSFDMEHEGGYLLTAGDKLKTPWYYIYNNRKLALHRGMKDLRCDPACRRPLEIVRWNLLIWINASISTLQMQKNMIKSL